MLLLAMLPVARADVAIPPVARVTDLSGVLSADQQQELDRKLAAFSERKGSQIAVLILPTTQPEDIAQFGIRVADAWKLGRKDVDDGAILIVATGDRHMRIEVGRGLEGAVTDLATHRILTEYLAPQFRSGNFYGGIDAALDRLMKLVDGEPLPPPAHEWRQSRGGLQGLLPLLLVFGLIAGPVLRGILGRPLGSLVTGAAAAVVAWLIVKTLVVAIFVGIAGFVLALIGGLGGGLLSGPGGGFGGGGWGGGGFGGGGFGGDGGGFSGGGGGFGGGGSSGSW
jgi:uncharacterized protein